MYDIFGPCDQPDLPTSDQMIQLIAPPAQDTMGVMNDLLEHLTHCCNAEVFQVDSVTKKLRATVQRRLNRESKAVEGVISDLHDFVSSVAAETSGVVSQIAREVLAHESPITPEQPPPPPAVPEETVATAGEKMAAAGSEDFTSSAGGSQPADKLAAAAAAWQAELEARPPTSRIALAIGGGGPAGGGDGIAGNVAPAPPVEPAIAAAAVAGVDAGADFVIRVKASVYEAVFGHDSKIW